MSMNRIVRRNLRRTGEMQHIKGKKGWIDLRPRDRFGILAGYCSKEAEEIRAIQAVGKLK